MLSLMCEDSQSDKLNIRKIYTDPFTTAKIFSRKA